MATYVILSRVSPEAFREPADFKQLAETVSERIKQECPKVIWRDSYWTMGQYDVVDIVDTDDFQELQRAIMIIRAVGRAWTQTMAATPWREFLNSIDEGKREQTRGSHARTRGRSE